MQKLVYDIGMHIGQDTEYYLKLGYKVLAVEANPCLVEIAKNKFKKHIDLGNLIILNVGINTTEEKLPFYVNKRLSEWSSFDKALGTRGGNYEIVEVQCYSTGKLFEEYGVPYYMKVDIEGYDHLCILGINENGQKPQFVSCEATSLDWLALLQAKGYNKFKVISQTANFDTVNLQKEKTFYYLYYLIVKNAVKRRLQNFVSVNYKYGSSGPFGEASKGSWMTYEEAKELYTGFFDESGAPLNKITWFDFHASL
jgi:FkbM family methyltransferase